MTWGLFYKALVDRDKPQTMELWGKVQKTIDSYDDLFDFIKVLYYLAGFCPEAADEAVSYVGVALNPPQEWTERFKDVPVAEKYLTIYQRFADGKSRGLGDPDDFRIHFGIEPINE